MENFEYIKGMNVPAPVVPYTNKDVYPTHEAIYGKGGWKSVKDIESLKAIPRDRLEDGCIVRVVNSGSGSSAEFYYDSKIIAGSLAPSAITDPIEREVYPYSFRKWAPGYLPTKVSDLENDKHFVSEVYSEEDGKYVYLNPEKDKGSIEDILVSRARGIYQELALSYLYKNSRTTLKVDTNEDGTIDGNDDSINVLGLVTVDDTGKIPNELLEYPGKYVESVVAMFPDDFCEDPLDPAAYFVYLDGKPSKTDKEGKPVTDATDGSWQSEALKWDKPEVVEQDQKYYITEYYQHGESGEALNAYRNKVATVTSSDPTKFSWVATDPIFNDIIYIDEFRRTAFIVKDEGLIVEKSIGRDLIRTIEELMRPATIEEVPTEWDHWGISAKVAYQILLEIDKIIAWGEDISEEKNERKNADAELNARIDALLDKLNAHIQDKNNPHQVTRKQLGVDVDDEVTFSKVYANSFFMSTGSSKVAAKSVSPGNDEGDGEELESSPQGTLPLSTTPEIPAPIALSSKISPRVDPTGGKYEWEKELEAERLEREEADRKINARIDEVEAAMDAHIARRDNPHETKRSHLKIDTTDSVTFSKVNAPNGFFQKSGVAAVFRMAESTPEEIMEAKLTTLEKRIKELESEIAELKKK